MRCGRCGGHHQIAANWPDAAICVYCYQQAKRTRGTCACGHQGVLPGAPACRGCSGVKLNVDCRSCGLEYELYDAGRCWSCVLAATVDQLLASQETGQVAPQLVTVAAALKSMKRANSGLTWISQPHVRHFLTGLVAHPTITHEALDALEGPPRTRDYVRGLLVEHGALPRRDELKIRYRKWADNALQRISEPAMRDVIERYVRWHHLRRMNQMEAVPHGTFLRSKQTVTVAIDFVNWLTAEQISLAVLDQGHIDKWLATGTATRLVADRFLTWAKKARLVPPDLSVPRHRRGGSSKLSAAEQETAVQLVVYTDELSPRDRAAAILVIVFGQQIQKVAELTWDDVTVTDAIVSVRLGGTEIAIPEPLDGPWRKLAASPGNDQTAANPASSWVFRGHTPGQHVSAQNLRYQLRDVFSARAARLGTLHELTKLAPIAIIAEMLGYSPATIERHAIASAASYSEYIAGVHDHGVGSHREARKHTT